MVRHIILSSLGLASGLTSGFCSNAADAAQQAGKTSPSERKPNVVIFFTDDQGAIDVNRFGATDLATPNMDRLCNSGIQFTNFYANSSISSPSRASLLTGRYPQRAGMPQLASPDPAVVGLPAGETTIAEILRDNGYATAVIGKWHLGSHPESRPNAQGFDYFFGHLGGCIDNYSHYFYWNGPNRHDLSRNNEEVWYEGRNFSDMMVEESCKYIEQNRDKPFFLYFSSNYPHYPLQGDSKWREYYKNAPSPRDKYAAMVSTIDEKIGMVIDKIEAEGLRDNTIIIFMSDNGYSTEDRTFSGGGSAGVMRGAKFSTYEGGIRVPAILSYPPLGATGVVCNKVGMGCDWLPTILDICKIEQPKQALDGMSLLPMITNDKQQSPHKVINWEVGKNWAVLKGDYKLVGNIGNKTEKAETIELYNLKDDLSESNDLSKDMPAKAAELKSEREKWLKSLGR